MSKTLITISAIILASASASTVPICPLPKTDLDCSNAAPLQPELQATFIPDDHEEFQAGVIALENGQRVTTMADKFVLYDKQMMNTHYQVLGCTASANECAGRCIHDSECVAFAYSPATQVCYHSSQEGEVVDVQCELVAGSINGDKHTCVDCDTDHILVPSSTASIETPTPVSVLYDNEVEVPGLHSSEFVDNDDEESYDQTMTGGTNEVAEEEDQEVEALRSVSVPGTSASLTQQSSQVTNENQDEEEECEEDPTEELVDGVATQDDAQNASSMETQEMMGDETTEKAEKEEDEEENEEDVKINAANSVKVGMMSFVVALVGVVALL